MYTPWLVSNLSSYATLGFNKQCTYIRLCATAPWGISLYSCRCQNGSNGKGTSLICKETWLRVQSPMDKNKIFLFLLLPLVCPRGAWSNRLQRWPTLQSTNVPSILVLPSYNKKKNLNLSSASSKRITTRQLFLGVISLREVINKKKSTFQRTCPPSSDPPPPPSKSIWNKLILLLPP